MSGRRRSWAVRAGTRALLYFLPLALATVAFAQARLPTRRLGIDWSDGAPALSFSVTDLVDRRARDSLESGLRKHLVVTLQAYRSRGDRPVASRQVSCSVTYDLWEQAYVIRAGSRSAVRPSLGEVIQHCLVFRGIRVGHAGDYDPVRGEQVYFAVRAEFNPITRSRCARLLRSAGSDDPIGPVVVNIVRREICQAERAVDFRSQATTVP